MGERMSKDEQKEEVNKVSAEEAINAALEAEPELSTTEEAKANPKPEPSKGLTTEDMTSQQDTVAQGRGEAKWFDKASGVVKCPKCKIAHVTRVYKGAILVRQCLNPGCLHKEEFR